MHVVSKVCSEGQEREVSGTERKAERGPPAMMDGDHVAAPNKNNTNWPLNIEKFN